MSRLKKTTKRRKQLVNLSFGPLFIVVCVLILCIVFI